MKPLVLIVSLSILAGTSRAADNQSAKGAKSLYYNSNTDTTAPSGTVSRQTSATRPAAPRTNTGLKYWVELVQPNSTQILRVNSTRVFHSGERIRLHFETNVNGRIVLLQMNPNGTSQTLFPDARVNGGDNYIHAGADTTIPSANSWFTLDNNQGTERVMVFLNAEPAAASGAVTTQRAAAASAKPAPATVPRNTFPSSPDGQLDAASTADLVAQIEKQRGSKALLLEVDDKSDTPADYVVKPMVTKIGSHGSAAESLAIEINLKHQ